MKKLFSLISVFALAMGAMAETQSATLTITESTTVTDNKVSQNGIVVSNVGYIEIDPYDGGIRLAANDESMVVSLADGYDINKIVITPQPGYEGVYENADWIVVESSVTWTKDGDNAVWEGNAKSVPFGDTVNGYAVKDIIVYYDDATATAAVEAQADKQKAVKSVNRFDEVTIEADGVKYGINGVKK